MKIRNRDVFRSLWVLLFCLVGGDLCAVPIDTNHSVRYQRVQMVRQGRIENLSILDGRLCYRMGGMMYATPIGTMGAEGVDVAADLMAVDAEMTYVVRHPTSGMLYYTKPDRNGTTLLYMYVPTARRNKSVQVLLEDYAGMVCHPTFTADGSIMVFATRLDSLGSMELCYSQWKEGMWSYPRSLGSTVNSFADDVNPYISGDYLYFASNRNCEDSTYALYMCRLVSTSKMQNDTIYSYPIGKGKVQRLPVPFNGSGVKPVMVYDTQYRYGFWVREGAAKDSPDELYAFHGDVLGTVLSGTVRGTSLQVDGSYTSATALPAARVTVYDNAYSSSLPLFSCYSDAQGRYSCYLQPNRTYHLQFHKEGYSDCADTIITQHNNGDVIYESRKKDAQLERLCYHVDYLFDNHRTEQALFHPMVGEAVSASGRQYLQRISRYLKDNPNTYLYLTVVYTEGEDAFNRLLTTQRVQSLQQVLWQEGVAQATLSRAVYETVVTATDELEGLSNAVLFFFSDKPIVEDRDKQGKSLRYFLEQEEKEDPRPVQQWDASLQNSKKDSEKATEVPATEEPSADEEEEPSEINPLFRQAMEQE